MAGGSADAAAALRLAAEASGLGDRRHARGHRRHARRRRPQPDSRRARAGDRRRQPPAAAEHRACAYSVVVLPIDAQLSDGRRLRRGRPARAAARHARPRPLADAHAGRAVVRDDPRAPRTTTCRTPLARCARRSTRRSRPCSPRAPTTRSSPARGRPCSASSSASGHRERAAPRLRVARRPRAGRPRRCSPAAAGGPDLRASERRRARSFVADLGHNLGHDATPTPPSSSPARVACWRSSPSSGSSPGRPGTPTASLWERIAAALPQPVRPGGPAPGRARPAARPSRTTGIASPRSL